MIGIKAADLPAHTARALEALQAPISAVESYAERVREARERYDAESRRGNPAFDVVRHTLESMCVGACRCMYCEDSAACEIEHFRPKAFYPDLVFVWHNYLYSCGACNRIKRSYFRIFVANTVFVDLVRRRNDPVIPPEDGLAVLIDPRSEDPLYYMGLDLVNTFWFVPRHPEGSWEYARAAYTIANLKLNERDELTQAREEAYAGYRARLTEYLSVRGTARAQLVAKAIKRCGHPSVWAEMKAQSKSIPDLDQLFQAAPEAYEW